MLKLLTVTILLIAFSIQKGYSQTKLKLVNNTAQTISAAYANYADDGSGWTSRGWWNINAGGSKIIDLGNYSYINVYVYGFYKNTGWGSGNYQFCVDFKNAFTIPNSDQTCNFVKRQFSEVKIVTGKINTWNFNPKSNAKPNNNSNTTVSNQTSTNLSQQQINEFVNRHNYWRYKVNSPKIVWSETLAQFAYQWAKYLADNNLFEHRNQDKYGENIFQCTSCTAQTYSPSKVVDEWASEKALYNGEIIDNSNYSSFGHYTQLIWCQTTQVGCAMVQSQNGSMVVVCNYNPGGNIIGYLPTCQ
jgi:uncharacterized protein YkwD